MQMGINSSPSSECVLELMAEIVPALNVCGVCSEAPKRQLGFIL